MIIRSGVLAVLRRLPSLDIQIEEIADVAQLPSALRCYKPDILIVNPSVTTRFPIPQLKAEGGSLRLVAYSFADEEAMKLYDETVTVYDTADRIADKIMRLTGSEHNQDNRSNALSSREKEIVVGVVKGLTNKQIADSLFISTHTVITHRRNIAAKLQIHSAAGLTIYAIVNKLVEFDEISSLINRVDV